MLVHLFYMECHVKSLNCQGHSVEILRNDSLPHISVVMNWYAAQVAPSLITWFSVGSVLPRSDFNEAGYK